MRLKKVKAEGDYSYALVALADIAVRYLHGFASSCEDPINGTASTMDWLGVHENKSTATLKLAHITALEPVTSAYGERGIKRCVVVLESCSERGVHRIAGMKPHFFARRVFDLYEVESFWAPVEQFLREG